VRLNRTKGGAIVWMMDSTSRKITELLSTKEGQIYEKKSVRTDVKDIADEAVAFANADGGKIVVGISNENDLEGFHAYPNRENEIYDILKKYIKPPVSQKINRINFDHSQGFIDYLLEIDIESSEKCHEDAKGDVYLRVGDKTIKLDFEERQKLLSDKGLRAFESDSVKDVSMDDLDSELISKYAEQVGLTDQDSTKILYARHLVSEKDNVKKITWAALLLFGKEPQRWHDLARIRVIRYEGYDEKTGVTLNVVKDEKINGPIFQQIKLTRRLVKSLLRDFSKLDPKTGKFTTTPEYPEFAWFEAIINAITHREYAVFGADIQIKIFDDRMEVISPGELPYIIRPDNIKSSRYSRNPKIARALVDMGYVKELGEGVDRMYREMEGAKLPEPIFTSSDGYVKVVLHNNYKKRSELDKNFYLSKRIRPEYLSNITPRVEEILSHMLQNNNRAQTKDIENVLHLSRQRTVEILRELSKNGSILRKSGELGPKAFYEINPEILMGSSDSLSTYPQEKNRNTDTSSGEQIPLFRDP